MLLLFPGNPPVLYSVTHPLFSASSYPRMGWEAVRIAGMCYGGVQSLEVGLSLNGVFGKPTGFA